MDGRMGIPADRQDRRGMPGQHLRRLDGRPAPDDRGDVARAQGVEVGHPARGVLVVDAGGGQVRPHHGGRLEPGHRREGGGVRRPARQEGPQQGRQAIGDGLFGPAAILRVGGLTDDHGGRLVKPERSRRQFAQLPGPEPGPEGGPVEHGVIRPAHPFHRRPGFRGGHQPGGFRHRQGAALMAAVRLRIEQPEGRQLVIPDPPGHPLQPSGEPLDAAQVGVERFQAAPGRLEGHQGGLHAIGGQVGQASGGQVAGDLLIGQPAGVARGVGGVDVRQAGALHQRHHAGGPRPGLIGMLRGVPLGGQEGVEVRQVFPEGPRLMGGVPFRPAVDDAPLTLGGFRLPVPRQGFTLRLVRVGGFRHPFPVLIGVCDDPTRSGALAIGLPLEHTGHGSSPVEVR
jgi:hypothetical protein